MKANQQPGKIMGLVMALLYGALLSIQISMLTFVTEWIGFLLVMMSVTTVGFVYFIYWALKSKYWWPNSDQKVQVSDTTEGEQGTKS